MPLVTFYTPRKHQKTSGFFMFPEGIERTSGMKEASGMYIYIYILHYLYTTQNNLCQCQSRSFWRLFQSYRITLLVLAAM